MVAHYEGLLCHSLRRFTLSLTVEVYSATHYGGLQSLTVEVYCHSLWRFTLSLTMEVTVAHYEGLQSLIIEVYCRSL